MLSTAGGTKSALTVDDMGAPVGGWVAGKLRHSTHLGSISTNPVSTSFF